MGDKELIEKEFPGGLFPFFTAEQIEGLKFYVWGGERIGKPFSETWAYIDRVEENIRFTPLKRVPWPLTRGPESYESEEALWHGVKKFFEEHLDLPDPRLFDVLAAMIFASWIPEFWFCTPYLFLLGPKSSGKTRVLECMQRIAYRGLIGSSVTAAALFRAMEAWHPTLFLDETEIYNREELTEVVALLNAGQRRGQYAIRVAKIENGTPVLELFDTFGFKALAGTHGLKPTLESRSIIVTMQRAVRPLKLMIDERTADRLRAQLLAYRVAKIPFGLESVKGVNTVKTLSGIPDGRIQELFLPLKAVAATQAISTQLESYAKTMWQSVLDEEAVSEEAEIFYTIKSLHGNSSHKSSQESFITITDIAEELNRGVVEKADRWRLSRVGYVTKRLGFPKKREGGTGRIGIRVSPDLIMKLSQRYQVFQNNSSHPSQSSQTPPGLLTVEVSAAIPRIVGVDLESYGPFTPGSRATLPCENAKALIDRGVAKPVDLEEEA